MKRLFVKKIADNKLWIHRTSRRLIWLLTFLLVTAPIATALLWIFINQMPAEVQQNLLPAYVQRPLPLTTRLLGLGVAMIQTGLAMYGMWVLIRLFRLYGQGSIFRPANVGCFRKLSRVLIAWFITGIATDPLMSLALTLHHLPGQHMLSVGLGSPDLTALLVGGILSVITRVMDEGCKLQQEQDLTI